MFWIGSNDLHRRLADGTDVAASHASHPIRLDISGLNVVQTRRAVIRADFRCRAALTLDLIAFFAKVELIQGEVAVLRRGIVAGERWDGAVEDRSTLGQLVGRRARRDLVGLLAGCQGARAVVQHARRHDERAWAVPSCSVVGRWWRREDPSANDAIISPGG